MKCSLHQLLAYHSGELRGISRRRLQRHLEQCLRCQDLLQALQEMAREVHETLDRSSKLPLEEDPARFKCLSEEVRRAYLAGILPSEHRDLIIDHLVECGPCARQVGNTPGGMASPPIPTFGTGRADPSAPGFV